MEATSSRFTVGPGLDRPPPTSITKMGTSRPVMRLAACFGDLGPKAEAEHFLEPLLGDGVQEFLKAGTGCGWYRVGGGVHGLGGEEKRPQLFPERFQVRDVSTFGLSESLIDPGGQVFISGNEGLGLLLAEILEQVQALAEVLEQVSAVLLHLSKIKTLTLLQLESQMIQNFPGGLTFGQYGGKALIFNKIFF